MSPALYSGEPWMHQQARERLAARDRERADADARAEAERTAAARARAVREPDRPADPRPIPPERSAPAEPPKRRTWRDLTPDELHRF